MDFLGFSNVVDATPIINAKDGLTDGFVVKYYEFRNGKRIDKQATKYVREFDFNSVGNDGNFYGFGRGTVYVRSGKKTAKKAKGVITDKKLLSLIKVN